MPVIRCVKNGKKGWKWGNEGFCYTGSEAKEKAIAQGIAIILNKKEDEKKD